MNRFHAAVLAASACLCISAVHAKGDARSRATAECRKEIAQRGYQAYRLENLTAMEGRSGVAVVGQMADGDKRFEFTCVFDQTLKLTDLPINALPAKGDTAAK
jgi:hypothetical protein